jgi:hypothetical protein
VHLKLRRQQAVANEVLAPRRVRHPVQLSWIAWRLAAEKKGLIVHTINGEGLAIMRVPASKLKNNTASPPSRAKVTLWALVDEGFLAYGGVLLLVINK